MIRHHTVWPPYEPATTPLPWMDEGLCAQTDPEAFFPESGQSTIPAKNVCRTCPVRHECLEYALTHHIRYGVWGGLSERERRPIIAARNKGRVS